MKNIFEVLKRHNLKATSFIKKNNVFIVTTNHGKFVLKKKANNIFNYLYSRSFDYYPNIIEDDDYLITEYIEEVDMPKDQKMLDLISLTSLLHNKTTFYKNVDYALYEKIYDELKDKINYTFNYYDSIMNNIESKTYLNPYEFLLATNISIIFASLNWCSIELEKWYKKEESNNKIRYVLIHNNLDLEHFIKNKEPYLISFDRAKEDMPIYDLYILYKKYALDFDFKHIFSIYQKKYPLLKEEKELLHILISIPDVIDFKKSIYKNSVNVQRLIDYLYKTEELVLPNNTKDTKQDENSK